MRLEINAADHKNAQKFDTSEGSPEVEIYAAHIFDSLSSKLFAMSYILKDAWSMTSGLPILLGGKQ